jgi:hypothetical protein
MVKELFQDFELQCEMMWFGVVDNLIYKQCGLSLFDAIVF